jgi:hypothetical protein
MQVFARSLREPKNDSEKKSQAVEVMLTEAVGVLGVGVRETHVATMKTMALVFTQLTVDAAFPGQENVLRKHPEKVNPEV